MCLTTPTQIASLQNSKSFPGDKLLPASSIAHVDRGIRVEHQAALLPRFVEVERRAGITRLRVADSRTVDLQFYLRQKL